MYVCMYIYIYTYIYIYIYIYVSFFFYIDLNYVNTFANIVYNFNTPC